MNTEAIREILDQQGESFEQFKKSQTARLEALEANLDQVELKHARAGISTVYGGGPIVHESEHKALDVGMRALIAGDQVKANRAFAELKAMSAGSDPDGGWLVHPVLSQSMTRILTENSPVYRLARKIPLSIGSSFEEPVDNDSLAATWVSELGTRADTATPQLMYFKVDLHEIFTMPKLSQKLIDTANINVTNWLLQKSGEAFATTESQAFHTGDGVGRPRGFLAYSTSTAPDSSRPFGTVQHIATGASGAFPTSSTTVNPADVLVDVVTAMKSQYRMGAVWLMNRSTAGLCRKLKDSEGRHVWVEGLQLGQPSVLLGYPVEIDEQMPDVGAGTFAIAFANLEQAYTIIEMPGIKFLSDPFTDKPNVRLYSYRRVGAGLNNSEAVKILKFS